jgi:hypothetical protein
MSIERCIYLFGFQPTKDIIEDLREKNFTNTEAATINRKIRTFLHPDRLLRNADIANKIQRGEVSKQSIEQASQNWANLLDILAQTNCHEAESSNSTQEKEVAKESTRGEEFSAKSPLSEREQIQSIDFSQTALERLLVQIIQSNDVGLRAFLFTLGEREAERIIRTHENFYELFLIRPNELFLIPLSTNFLTTLLTAAQRICNTELTQRALTIVRERQGNINYHIAFNPTSDFCTLELKLNNIIASISKEIREVPVLLFDSMIRAENDAKSNEIWKKLESHCKDFSKNFNEVLKIELAVYSSIDRQISSRQLRNIRIITNVVQ